MFRSISGPKMVLYKLPKIRICEGIGVLFTSREKKNVERIFVFGSLVVASTSFAKEG